MGIQDLSPLYGYIRPQNLTLDGRRQNWHKWACGGYSRGQDHVPQECTLKGIGPEYSYLWNSFDFKMTNLRKFLKNPQTYHSHFLSLHRHIWPAKMTQSYNPCYAGSISDVAIMVQQVHVQPNLPNLRKTQNCLILQKLIFSSELVHFFLNQKKKQHIFLKSWRRWEILEYFKIPTVPDLIMTIISTI